jgi:flagellar protein FlgJ
LADLIHDQIIDKYGAMMGLKPQESRPMGPIHIDNQKSSRGALKIENPRANHFMPVDNAFTPSSGEVAPGASPDKLKTLKTTIRYDLQKAALEDKGVTAPWSGTLLGVKSLSADEHILEMAHDNGLKSQMVFRGRLEKDLQPSQMKPGTEIQAGQRLGLLSPEAKSFFWTVDVNASL